jgi:CheY-like chemotaxis protein
LKSSKQGTGAAEAAGGSRACRLEAPEQRRLLRSRDEALRVGGEEIHNRIMAAPSSRPVLLVEDSEDDILLLQRALTRIHSPLPLQVITEGHKAWEYLTGKGSTTRPNRPSLIVLDLKLPAMSGLELLGLLKWDPQLRNVPVIVMSGSREPSEVAAAYALGADFYMVKSVDSEVTFEQAKAMHDYWTAIETQDDPARMIALSHLKDLAEHSAA